MLDLQQTTRAKDESESDTVLTNAARIKDSGYRREEDQNQKHR